MIALIALALAEEPVLDALSTEIDRSLAELVLPDSDRPYFVSYRLEDEWDARFTAVLGGISSESVAPRRALGVAVRVGSPEYDSANFSAGFRSENGYLSRSLVIEDVPLAIRRDAWIATDEAYKAAVSNMSAKRAADARRAEPDDIPDYEMVPPTTHDGGRGPTMDAGQLRELAIRASERFLDHPELEDSRVYTRAKTGRYVVLDSTGTRVTQPIEHVYLDYSASIRAADGSEIGDSRELHVRSFDALPDAAAIDALIDDLAADLVAWRSATVPEDPYIGPVLIEPEAAPVLFRALLIPALRGTPEAEKPPSGSRVFDFDLSSGKGPLGLKRRILPTGWSVRDDPTTDPKASIWRTHDDEGTPIQPLELVADGIVRTHYMSRTPSKLVAHTNGRGFASLGGLAKGDATSVTVTPGKVLSDRKLHKLAMRLASGYGSDHYLAIRRFSSRAEKGLGGNQDDVLGMVRVYADGREEPVRGVKINGLDRRALRDIVGAGLSTTQIFRGGLGGLEVTAPAVLLEEIEAVPAIDSSEKPPPLVHPLARE